MTQTSHLTKKIFFGAFFFLCFISLSSPFFAHADAGGAAQGNISPSEGLSYTPLVALPGVTESGTNQISNLSTYIVGMFQLLIGVAAALAVVMIVIGGIEYMSTDAIGGKSDGKKKIENALWGLALAISSYLILNTIDPSFLNSDIDVASQQQQSTTQ